MPVLQYPNVPVTDILALYENSVVYAVQSANGSVEEEGEVEDEDKKEKKKRKKAK